MVIYRDRDIDILENITYKNYKKISIGESASTPLIDIIYLYQSKISN